MDRRTRKILLCGLLCAFCIQSSFVYFDNTGRKTPPLSEIARQGQHIWLSHNCQSCHQIYGFGGFLGPDLTNAVKRLTPYRIESILTQGSAQMPAYHFSEYEREALISFLKAVDITGQGVPSIGKDNSSDPVQHFNTVAKKMLDEARDPDLHRGFELVQNYACLSCHLPNSKSVFQAPDLSLVANIRSKDEIAKVLVEGRVEKGMPPFNMPESDRDSVFAFLKWLNRSRDNFLKIYHNADQQLSMFDFIKKIQWFEYE